MILSATDSGANNLIMLLLVLCACTIMIMLLRRHQFRATSRRDLGREQLVRLRDQRRLYHSMDDLLVQLEDASRRIGAQLDTKFAKLEAVIRDADERIARLEGILGRREAKETPRTTPPEQRVASQTGPAPRESSRAGTPGEFERGGSGGDSRCQRVYELLDAGVAPIRVAEQLGLPLGEVELIMKLRDLR